MPELDWKLLEPTIKVAARRTMAMMKQKTGSAMRFEEIRADFMSFIWEKRAKYDPGLAKQNTWAEGYLRNRTLQLVSDYCDNTFRFVSLDTLTGRTTGDDYTPADIPDEKSENPMAKDELDAAIGDMIRQLNGDPVAQLVIMEMVDPSPEVRLATARHEAKYNLKTNITPTSAIAEVYNLHHSIVSLAKARVRAVLSGQAPAPEKVRCRKKPKPKTSQASMLDIFPTATTHTSTTEALSNVA